MSSPFIQVGQSDQPKRREGAGALDQRRKFWPAVWTAVTPNDQWITVNGGYQQNLGFGFSAVSVDRQNPNTIMVATLGRLYWPGEEIFRSLDGGPSNCRSDCDRKECS